MKMTGPLDAKMEDVENVPTTKNSETMGHIHNNAVCHRMKQNSPSRVKMNGEMDGMGAFLKSMEILTVEIS